MNTGKIRALAEQIESLRKIRSNLITLGWANLSVLDITPPVKVQEVDGKLSAVISAQITELEKQLRYEAQ